jgi:hypothetical protein
MTQHPQQLEIFKVYKICEGQKGATPRILDFYFKL